MVVETRSVSEEVNAEVEQRVRNIIAHSAAMHELDYKIEVIGGAIPINYDVEMAELALEEAKHVEGFSSFKMGEHNSMGSEDASFMIKRVQERGGKGRTCRSGPTFRLRTIIRSSIFRKKFCRAVSSCWSGLPDGFLPKSNSLLPKSPFANSDIERMFLHAYQTNCRHDRAKTGFLH